MEMPEDAVVVVAYFDRSNSASRTILRGVEGQERKEKGGKGGEGGRGGREGRGEKEEGGG